jgi:hypothetical protein
MTQLTRRDLFAGTAVAGLATVGLAAALPKQGHAAAPPAGKQAPGAKRHSSGARARADSS